MLTGLMHLLVFLFLINLSMLLLPLAHAYVTKGVTFYRVQGNRCLTTAPILQTFNNVQELSECMQKCHSNAQCATLQLYPQTSVCNLYGSITYDKFYAQSAQTAPGSCLLYNRKCSNRDWFFNYTAMYSLHVDNWPGLPGSNWYEWGRAGCINSRYDLLIIKSQNNLNYMLSNILISGGIWFIGGYYNSTAANYYWNDGSLLTLASSSNINGACTGDTNCLLFYSSYGIYRGSCLCVIGVLCGCDEWGLLLS